MAPSADEDERPHPFTVFRPLSLIDDTLAGQLVDEYLTALRDGLTIEEREYAHRYKPPRIEVATQPDGAQLLRVSFGGRMTMTDWDGTPEGAMSVVNDFGVIAADNASSDYWVTDGWRTQTTFTGETTDPEAYILSIRSAPPAYLICTAGESVPRQGTERTYQTVLRCRGGEADLQRG